MCVGCFITWYNSNWDVKLSSPSKLVLSWQNQVLDLALKYLTITAKNWFLCTEFSRLNPRFSWKFQIHLYFGLGIYEEDKKLQVLPPINKNIINTNITYFIVRKVIWTNQGVPRNFQLVIIRRITIILDKIFGTK